MAHRIFIAYLVKPADLVNKFLPMFKPWSEPDSLGLYHKSTEGYMLSLEASSQRVYIEVLS